MNKRGLIKKLQEELNYDEEKCMAINSIVEDTSLIGKKNKEIMISRFTNELNVTEEEANKIYETFMKIMGTAIKNKIIHPFK